MILEYHRPENLDEALRLLARETPLTYALGGGTRLSGRRKPDFAVVDLQRLGLNKIQTEGQLLRIGATVTLQQLMESEDFPEDIREALCESLVHESGQNIRQVATLAGTLVSCDGRSPFVTALLALDPRLVWQPGDDQRAGGSGLPGGSDPVPGNYMPLGDYLPLRDELGKGQLIVEVSAPLNAALRFASVARSPLDRPIVCAAVASWPSGRTRVTLGGFGKAPILAMDGPEPGGAAVAAREAFRYAEDEWASAAYRMDVAGKLVHRLLAKE